MKLLLALLLPGIALGNEVALTVTGTQNTPGVLQSTEIHWDGKPWADYCEIYELSPTPRSVVTFEAPRGFYTYTSSEDSVVLRVTCWTPDTDANGNPVTPTAASCYVLLQSPQPWNKGGFNNSACE